MYKRKHSTEDETCLQNIGCDKGYLLQFDLGLFLEKRSLPAFLLCLNSPSSLLKKNIEIFKLCIHNNRDIN